MFVIMVYDINEKRCNKVLKIGRKYLNWVQNSVFEGDITSARLEELKSELKKVMKEDEDSIIFYTFRSTHYSDRIIMGVQKGGEETII